MNGARTPPRRFCSWFDPRDAAAVAAIEIALDERETSLVQIDPADTPDEDAALVVFLSDHLLESAGEALEVKVEKWRGTVVPVALAQLTDNVPQAVERISWIEADTEPVEIVANRIALSGRTSPGWLLEWQEERTAAERVAAAGRAALLGERELDRAMKTVSRRPQDRLPEVPPDVRALIEGSRREIRRRQRRRLALAVATVVVLAGTGVVALLQRNSATTARERAEAATKRSEADRLSRLAVQGLAADPDLPLLLARRAYRLDPGRETWDSLRKALDAVPWHRSYRLRVIPRELAAAASSPLVVVVGADGSASLFDSRSGRQLAREPRPPGVRGIPHVAVSGDGHLVALAYAGGLAQVRRLDPRFDVVSSVRAAALGGSAPHSLVWLGGGRRLLMAWDSRPALTLDPRTGRTAELRASDVESPLALAVSVDGKLVAVAGHERIEILRTATLKPCWSESKRSSGSMTLVFDERREILFVGRTASVGLQIPIPADCGVPTGERPEMRSVFWSEGDVAAGLPDGGVVTGNSRGQVVLLEPPATYLAAGFRAHVAKVAGVGIAGRSLVTIGEDRWLRIWQPPALPAYPYGPAWLVSFNEEFGQSETRGTWRPMIASDASGSMLTLGGLSSGSVRVLRANRLDRQVRSFFIAIASSIRPAGMSPCAVLLFNGSATLYRCKGHRLRSVWSHRFVEQGQSLYESALSDNGRSVAIAGLRSLALVETPGGNLRRFSLGDLEGLGFDRTGRLFAFDGDGTMLLVPPSGAARRVAVRLGGCRVVLAGVEPSGQRALVICVNGEALLVDTSNGSALSRFRLDTDLSKAIGVRFSPSGRLAVIVGSDGYRVADLGEGRVIAAGGEYGQDEVGAQPRDATFLGPKRTVVVVRADEGLTPVELAPWRFLDGAALLHATAAAVPRQLRMGEVPEATIDLGGA